ncbi:MAG: sulfatase-like hydrolase/transferase [Bacteroidia bacterium]|nr:sulfatase-like hydrolase/transferase [Bacteroidia bacterium]
MLRRKLKLYTYHTFLVVPFIVLFLYAHNLELSKLNMTYRTLLFGTLFCLLLYGITQVIFRNRLKTGVFVTLVLFALFQYGVIYEFLEAMYYRGLWPLKNIHRYLIGFYLVVLSAVFWWAKKTKYDFIRLNYFLNALVILLLMFNLFKIAAYNYPDPAKKRGNQYILEKTIRFRADDRPNIYYIILDGYANNLVLEKYYSFKNTSFTSHLKEQGFVFCDSAFSNYYYTFPSLASTLNFDYINDSIPQSELIRQNRLFSILKANRYTISHLKSGYAVSSSFMLADKTITIDGPNEFEKSLLKFTILRLDDLIGFFAHSRLKSQFKKMYELSASNEKPKFCFIHIVAPHPPYIFDREGGIQIKHQFAEHSWEPKSFYVDQLVYVNRQMEKFTASILEQDKNAVILLQSDHGPWIKGSADEVFEARSKILYAYYSPKKLNIPSRSSSVNTFRYVLNGVFNAELPLLTDSAAGKTKLMADPIFVKKIGELKTP